MEIGVYIYRRTLRQGTYGKDGLPEAVSLVPPPTDCLPMEDSVCVGKCLTRGGLKPSNSTRYRSIFTMYGTRVMPLSFSRHLRHGSVLAFAKSFA